MTDSFSKISVQEVVMTSIKHISLSCSFLLLLLSITSCTHETVKDGDSPAMVQESASNFQEERQTAAPAAVALPVKYQTAGYVIKKQDDEDLGKIEENKVKVGARITSTRGPQPLWDIVKRLAALKRMNVSWASDVDKDVLVDVDINANDDFFESLDNMLRQVDYFHEMQGNTIVVKYKETRRFHIAMPFTKQDFTTQTGGNLLGNEESSNNVDGTIRLDSVDNKFDIWESIRLNLQNIMDTWSYRQDEVLTTEDIVDSDEEDAENGKKQQEKQQEKTAAAKEKDREEPEGNKGYFLIDKPVGIITVTAPRPVLEKVEEYIATLKKTLYKQISIEAKIIEVQLNNESSIGINWSSVLKNFNLSGTLGFGAGGQVYPFVFKNDAVVGDVVYNSPDRSTYFRAINPGQFISNISMSSKVFDVFLNALNEQGDAKILSNPKLSVMNGQPSLITVGRNVTYVDSIESKIDTDTNIVTYTVETERILSGVGMALTATIINDNEIIMNLVPVTSELLEPIEYRDIGNLGATVGLPIINVREMSTMVKVKDGEILVVGGLISDAIKNEGEFAPLLGDVPLLKYLFGFENKKHIKRELIILLRPRII
ncbi:MAG: pilus (MSHA type) biogenesis protein MshL [Desulfobacterales bacterium]|nr:MAG: pilus (MSHA type) biogenesis protein MshL [Desulfobacterales bacterium]